MRKLQSIDKFQSTLPARGATGTCPKTGPKTTLFQSTLPARGATFSRATRQVQNPYFNPRSPQGERQITITSHTDDSGFQSTLPARGATSPRKYRVSNILISIHAPRKGSDRLGRLLINGYHYFNPRSPQGERLMSAPLHPAPSKFQSTLPARGATAKVHKNSCSNSHYCLKLSFFLPSPTSCCTPKPKVSTEDPSSIWCEPPGVFLSACGSRFLKESEALLADRRPCSQNARSCFHSDCPGNKTAGCPSPGP